MLYYVDGFVYWYTSEALGKWFVETLGKILHVKFLVYAHLFMSIRISYINDHSILVYQDRYATYIMDKYLYTMTVKISKTFYKNILPYNIIFIKYDVSTSNDQV